MSRGVSENLRVYLRMEADLAALEIGGETVSDEVRAEVRAAWERLSDDERDALEKRTGRSAPKALVDGGPVIHGRTGFSRGMKVQSLCGEFDAGKAPTKRYNAEKQRMDVVDEGRPADRIVDAFALGARDQVTCTGCKKVLRQRDDELLASWTRRTRTLKGRSRP